MEQRSIFPPRTALSRELLRQRLIEHSGDETRHGFIGVGMNGPAPAIPEILSQAAVLVPIIDRAEGLTVLFTKRTLHLRQHAGQIAFPGGRIEPSDKDMVATALRETQEEIGLDPAKVDILGRLVCHVTGTGFAINPIVGMISPPFSIAPEPSEVAEIFEVPLDFLRDPANRQVRFRAEPRPVHFYSITFGDHDIWGATARIVVTLTDLLDSPQ